MWELRTHGAFRVEIWLYERMVTCLAKVKCASWRHQPLHILPAVCAWMRAAAKARSSALLLRLTPPSWPPSPLCVNSGPCPSEVTDAV